MDVHVDGIAVRPNWISVRRSSGLTCRLESNPLFAPGIEPSIQASPVVMMVTVSAVQAKGVAVDVAVGDGVGVCVAVLVGDGVNVGLGVNEGVGVEVSVGVGVKVGVFVGVCVGVREGVSV